MSRTLSVGRLHHYTIWYNFCAMMSIVSTDRQPSETQLDLVFRALGDRTRRDLLRRLAQEPSGVTDLAKNFDMTLAAVGKHLRVLEKAGLIQRTIRGRVHQCSLNALPLRDADQWLATYQKFWDENLDSLIDHLQSDPNDPNDP